MILEIHMYSTIEIKRNVLIHSQNAYNRHGLARLNSGANNSVQVSHVGGKDPFTWAITCCLTGYTLARSWIARRGMKTWTTHKWGFNCWEKYLLHSVLFLHGFICNVCEGLHHLWRSYSFHEQLSSNAVFYALGFFWCWIGKEQF